MLERPGNSQGRFVEHPRAIMRSQASLENVIIDSLDIVELLMNLEDEIGVEIELAQKVETIADLDKFIQRKVQG